MIWSAREGKVSSWHANAGEEKLKMDTSEMKHPRRDTFFVICAPCTLYVCDSVGCDGRKPSPELSNPMRFRMEALERSQGVDGKSRRHRRVGPA
jgi:hypothetical protein